MFQYFSFSNSLLSKLLKKHIFYTCSTQKCAMVQTVSHRTLASGVPAKNHVCLNEDFVAQNVGMGDLFLRCFPFSFVINAPKPIFSFTYYRRYVILATDSVLTKNTFVYAFYNRSVVYSKMSSPQNAIWCFLFQFPVSP